LRAEAETIFRIVKENHVRFLVLTSSDRALRYEGDVYRRIYQRALDENPSFFVAVFKSESGAIVYRIESGP
jgi:hypothetical protein